MFAIACHLCLWDSRAVVVICSSSTSTSTICGSASKSKSSRSTISCSSNGCSRSGSNKQRGINGNRSSITGSMSSRSIRRTIVDIAYFYANAD